MYDAKVPYMEIFLCAPYKLRAGYVQVNGNPALYLILILDVLEFLGRPRTFLYVLEFLR